MTTTPSDRARSRLIFALDVSDGIDEALLWVRRLRDHVGLFKVGKEAFTSLGPEIVHRIRQEGAEVFLDLKFHDIPNTVARAAEAACGLGVAMFNVHASGGRRMIADAADAVRRCSGELGIEPPLVLAVTVLTSLDGKDLQDIGFALGVEGMVLRLAGMARDAGTGGVVASPHDAAAIRQACGKDFIIVTPGIRGADAVSGDDQKRAWSAEKAIREGADFVVVGRPIRLARDPAAEADRIVAQIREGLSGRSA
ncbi:MAG: orotidine-5'-phosphate decarboxylase [Deltaproteobacteria bacterium HGW-Deltaproteobacteria-19]|jgi:orotidine-5'-phosphate decarboxylase|nr:MAG: orotidine-5'-phosphate decarboxylase [Deltaproteobacteria bacterium HGW-Deltaproteobacteria-19]